jgi:protein SCO1/2
VTGDPASIYRQGNNGYLLSALEDSTAAEQFVHDERFVLVDKRRNIRGYYDGTDTEEMGRLVTDIKMLMKEEKERALKVGRFKE